MKNKKIQNTDKKDDWLFELKRIHISQARDDFNERLFKRIDKYEEERKLIYHIKTLPDWESQKNNDHITADSLKTEGFIHCSPKEKVAESAEKFFKAQDELVVLSIDTTKLSSKVVWEDLYETGFEFPHVYGEIESEAVTGIVTIKRNEEGVFNFVT